VTEHPVFVPHGDGHLAAVVTVPDGWPRGLVALLPGIGAGRAHRFQVWALTARELGRRGIASVRIDWEGVGDSSGDVDAWGWGVERSLFAQANAVVDVARRAVGDVPTAATGNCSGARIAMLMGAESPGCLGSVCLLLPMVPSSRQQVLRRRSARGVLAAVRRNALVRRVVVRRIKDRTGMDEVAKTAIARTLERGRLLLLYGQDDQALSGRTREQMGDLVGGLSQETASRYELRTLPVSRMAGFDSLETQRRAIDEIVDWLDGIFPEATAAAASA